MLSISVMAQDEVKKWSGESELSFVKNSGNTVSNSLLAKQTVIFDSRPWKNTLKIEANNVSSDGVDPITGKSKTVRTGERYYFIDQVDRYVSSIAYAFLRGTHEKDRFSSFDHQSTMVLGYGHTFVDRDSIKLKGEVGLGRSVQEWYPCDTATCDPNVSYGKTVSSPLRYLSETFIWKISNSAEFGQDVSVEDTKDNRVNRLHVYVKAQLVGSLAMKLGYQVRHVAEVADGKKNSDKEVTASLIYSF